MSLNNLHVARALGLVTIILGLCNGPSLAASKNGISPTQNQACFDQMRPCLEKCGSQSQPDSKCEDGCYFLFHVCEGFPDVAKSGTKSSPPKALAPGPGK